MAKTILTTFQQKLLDILANDPYITRRFYFTGGTVLSQFYLHHRLSEDFDLFSEKEVYLSSVAAFLTKIAPELGIDTMEHRPFLGLHSFILRLKNNTQFKIDFNYYPFLRMLVSFDIKKMEKFFLNEAKKLKKEILK